MLLWYFFLYLQKTLRIAIRVVPIVRTLRVHFFGASNVTHNSSVAPIESSCLLYLHLRTESVRIILRDGKVFLPKIDKCNGRDGFFRT